MEISFSDAKKRLILLWVVLGGFVVIIVFIQTITGRYSEIEKQAWEWFSPYILPNLTLIVASKFGDKTDKDFKIDRLYYRVCYALSVVYLLMLITIIFSYSSSRGKILDYYRSFNLIIMSIQAIVTASLSLFFVNKR